MNAVHFARVDVCFLFLIVVNIVSVERYKMISVM